jgi:hypothetical protein
VDPSGSALPLADELAAVSARMSGLPLSHETVTTAPGLITSLAVQTVPDQPPPETVRRLTRAVLAHQRGVLQDDASILLASWGRDRTV